DVCSSDLPTPTLLLNHPITTWVSSNSRFIGRSPVPRDHSARPGFPVVSQQDHRPPQLSLPYSWNSADCRCVGTQRANGLPVRPNTTTSPAAALAFPGHSPHCGEHRWRRRGAAPDERSWTVFARSTTVHGRTESIAAGIQYVHNDVMPMVRGIDGCVGLSMLVDDDSGTCIVTSAWRTGEAMRSSERQIRLTRAHTAEILEGDTQ